MSASSSPSNEEPVAQMAQLSIDTKQEDKSTVEDKDTSPSISDADTQDINEQQSVVEMVNPALDAVILAALRKPQDRIFLLKLDLEFESFINNPQRVRLDFPQMNSYQRLIVHRVATYFKLTHLFDPVRRSIYLCKNVSTEIPAIRFADLIEKEEEPVTNTPKFKIMRRLSSSRGHRKGDVSPAESNQSSDSKSALDRKQMTLEERKVAYEEARARIFQDFESNSGEGSEVETGSQPSSSTGSPAIKAAVEKKSSGTSTPDESVDEATAGITRNLSNRGKQLTPRSQSNPKRPSPRDKESTADVSQSYSRLDNRFTAQTPPFLPNQTSPYQSSSYVPQQPATYNSRNNSPFGYPSPYTNTPLYDPYGANLVQPQPTNPNFASYWKPHRPPSANSISISPPMSVAGSSSQQQQPPSQPLSRVWNPNTNTSTEPWGLQEFTPAYGDNMRMRPQRPPTAQSNGQLYNPNSTQDMQFQDQRPVQGSYNGQMNNSNVSAQGVWSTRPDNRDWGPLW
ncbi:hypothetical protein BGW37DRAFT_521758 [Umbelopsis sp. PMI_123]|nr:hypothetical protein BGW37DRAFT_521758 [Umbelopsis sp. PMI_123]